MQETTFKNGHLICPLGTGRYGVRQRVLLVVQKTAEGEIIRAFFRVCFDGHVVEATNRKDLKAKVDATFNDNKDQRWFRFLVPSLNKDTYGGPKTGYHKVIANASCFGVMEPSVRGAKTPGTRIRYEDQNKKGTFLQENQVAIADSGHGDFIPDTVKTRKAVEAIQRELTRAVKKAEKAMERLQQRNRDSSGDEYTGDKR